jgi:hypothetical protein
MPRRCANLVLVAAGVLLRLLWLPLAGISQSAKTLYSGRFTVQYELKRRQAAQGFP